MRRGVWMCAGCIIAALAAGRGPAFGHAFLDHAEPRVGSEATGVSEVKIWFTEEVEPAFSSIEVRDADGKQVDKKDTHLDAKNKQLLIVSVGSLPAGTYKVVWKVVAADTHMTNGDFTFVVKGK